MFNKDDDVTDAISNKLYFYLNIKHFFYIFINYKYKIKKLKIIKFIFPQFYIKIYIYFYIILLYFFLLIRVKQP